MTHYSAYLEMTAADGPGIVHVLDLPGCFVRAATREQALERLPQAIRAYHAWLRRHGEPAPSEGEPVQVELVEEVAGFGACQRGDKAALFSPERAPIAPEDMEPYFRLAAHSRADLLDLVADLREDALDWPPGPESYNIRGLLRHIGNAEEWYVSRLVPPETLPPEWEHDEDMPMFDFLEMERRTALARLRQLTDEERAAVFYPSQWTEHPDEPWTARKALRRFLEHEREHIAQIRDILAAQRHHLLARLAAARADLLEQFAGLDERASAELPVHGDWTLQDTLAHIAAWDRWVLQELRRGQAGEPPDIATVRDIDGYNAASVAAWRDHSLGEVITEFEGARAAWVSWMEGLPLEAFFRRCPVGRGDWAAPTWIQVMEEHEGEHTKEIAAWREAQGLKGEPWNLQTGCKDILLLALAAVRQELLSAAALVPAEERDARPLCGDWTLKDVLGHVVDWEWLAVEGLRHMAAGRPPQIEHVADVDAWNQAHVEARRDQPWDVVWTDLQRAREALREVLAGIDPVDMGRIFPSPWDEKITLYSWVYISVYHDHEHAQDLRRVVFGLPEEEGPAEA